MWDSTSVPPSLPTLCQFSMSPIIVNPLSPSYQLFIIVSSVSYAILMLVQKHDTQESETDMLPTYSRFTVGNWIITQQIVCNDGTIRNVTIEQYADGYHAFVQKEDGKYTNHKGYKTTRKAINAAAKF